METVGELRKRQASMILMSCESLYKAAKSRIAELENAQHTQRKVLHAIHEYLNREQTPRGGVTLW